MTDTDVQTGENMSNLLDAEAHARSMIKTYGWVVARRIAEAEARPHSPSGNQDGFWTRVLTVMDEFNGSVSHTG